MSVTEISRRYAKALFSDLKQKGQHTQGLNELREVQKILETESSFQAFMENPKVSVSQKTKVVTDSFSDKGLNPSVLQFLILLTENGRINLIRNVVLAYEAQLDAEMGVTRGLVRAAKPLSPEHQKALEAKMNEVLKKRIVLTYKEDPALLAGVIAEVGGWTFDDSIQSHLTHLQENLIQK